MVHLPDLSGRPAPLPPSGPGLAGFKEAMFWTYLDRGLTAFMVTLAGVAMAPFWIPIAALGWVIVHIEERWKHGKG